MRSIPIAMTWELLRRGRWQMLLGIAGANAIPLLVLTALRFDGALDPAEPGLITLQFVLVLLHVFCFGACVYSAMNINPRAYALPIPTSTLVAWRLFPGMLLVSLEMMLSVVFLNVVFDLSWPVWGPALLASVSVAMIMAALWSAEKTPLLPFSIGLAGAIIGLWYKSRWGAMFSAPSHVWATVTPGEVLTLLLFTVVSYGIAVVGVARSRCGDKLSCYGLVAALEQCINWPLNRPVAGTVSFRTPTAAQFWCEWEKKGWVAPGMVGFSLILWGAIWLLFSRELSVMLEGLVAGGFCLSIAGLLCGLIVGNCGPSDSNSEMGTFLATRPLTDRDLALTILKVSARTVLTSWAMWAAPFVIIASVMWISGTWPLSLSFNALQWWYLPATLLGLWIVLSNMISMNLTGRGTLVAKLIFAVVSVLVATVLLSKLLDHETQMQLFSLMLMMAGVAFGLFAVWAMTTARRRSLIEPWAVVAAGLAWAGISAIVIVECVRNPSATVATTVFLVGVVSLSVAPLAAAPLAIACNRHR